MNLSEKERLARIETLLESAVLQRAEDREAMADDIKEIKDDIKGIRSDLDIEKASNAALRNRGIGVLASVGVAAGAIGAFADRFFDKLFGS